MYPIASIALAASVALYASSVPAQESAITAEEAEAWVQQVVGEAHEIVESGEIGQVVQWVERNVAAEAVLQAGVTIWRDDAQKAYLALTLDYEDVLAWAGIIGAAGEGGVQDYALEAEVTDFAAAEAGAATVHVRWREDFSLQAPGEGEAIAPLLAGSVTAECAHILQRQGDSLVMGLSTCTGEIRM